MERLGRDPDELVVSMLWGFLEVTGKEQLIDMIGEYGRAGLHHLVGVPSLRPGALVNLSSHDLLQAALEDMQQFASEVLPVLQ